MTALSRWRDSPQLMPRPLGGTAVLDLREKELKSGKGREWIRRRLLADC
jgi:hypothetical protein